MRGAFKVSSGRLLRIEDYTTVQWIAIERKPFEDPFI